MKIPIYLSIIAGVLIYVFLGIPLLETLVSSQGILIAYPIYLFGLLAFSYIIGSIAQLGIKTSVVFTAVFILADVLAPPMLISMTAIPTFLPGQQLAGDVFFYTLFAELGSPHLLSWMLTYVLVPIIMLLVLLLELGRHSFTRTMKGIL